MDRVRIGMDDRRRQLFKPLKLRAVGDSARSPRPVGCHKRREQPRGRRRPLTAAQPAGVGRAIGITAERPVKELNGDRQHQSSSSGQVDRIAFASAAPGRSVVDGRFHPSSGTATDSAWLRAASRSAPVATAPPISHVSSSEPPSHVTVLAVGRRSAPERSANACPKASWSAWSPSATRRGRAAASAPRDASRPRLTRRS